MDTKERHDMNTDAWIVAAIVGINECSRKCIRGALERLSDTIHVAGVGDVAL